MWITVSSRPQMFFRGVRARLGMLYTSTVNLSESAFQCGLLRYHQIGNWERNHGECRKWHWWLQWNVERGMARGSILRLSGWGGERVGQEGKEANKGCAIKNCGQLWAQPAGDSGKWNGTCLREFHLRVKEAGLLTPQLLVIGCGPLLGVLTF